MESMGEISLLGPQVPVLVSEVPAGGSSGLWPETSSQARNQLSHIWDPSLEGSQNFSPKVPPGNFRWPGSFGLQAGSFGPGSYRWNFG